MSQLVGSVAGVVIALAGGFIIYSLLNAFLGLRLDQEQEYIGADLSIHKIASTSPDDKS